MWIFHKKKNKKLEGVAQRTQRKGDKEFLIGMYLKWENYLAQRAQRKGGKRFLIGMYLKLGNCFAQRTQRKGDRLLSK
jgi:hypothetical protein